MLGQLKLDETYKQRDNEPAVAFLNSYEWQCIPWIKDIDIHQYDGSSKTYVNEYVSYLEKNVSFKI